MANRGYAAPRTLDEAVELLKATNGSTRVLAGGTDLLVQMRTGRVHPELIVDVKRIPELTRITVGDDGLRLGAAVSGAEISEHRELVRNWPGLAEAADLIGSSQIQGRGTRRRRCGRTRSPTSARPGSSATCRRRN